MRYHNIEHESMLNGSGIRVVLFVSGCEHNCKNCHNPQTHDFNSGIEFDQDAIDEIRKELEKDYVEGLTLSGGDPLSPYNCLDILVLCELIKKEFPNKTIWCYTGYTWEELQEMRDSHYAIGLLLDWNIDVLVEGRFVDELKDVNYPYAGSTNQRVLDVKLSNRFDKKPVNWIRPS